VDWGTGTGDRASHVVFDGTAANYVDPSVMLPQMTASNDFSWSVWANVQGAEYTDSTGAKRNSIIIGNRRNTATPGAEFSPRQFVKITQLQFELHHNTSPTSHTNVNYDNLPIGEWTHIAIVKTGDQLQAYQNGVAAGAPLTMTSMAEAMPFFIGGDRSTQAGEFFQGFIDEVRLYDNALSLSEVQELAGIPEPSTSLLGALGLGLLVGRRRR
jgi:hypothetical protein